MVIPVAVECYSGHRGEETPRAIRIADRRIVVEVADRWLAPDHRYFRLASPGGDTYIIRHDVAQDRWELTMFRAGGV